MSEKFQGMMSPGEIVAWLEREIAPQRLPGRVKIQLTEMLDKWAVQATFKKP